MGGVARQVDEGDSEGLGRYREMLVGVVGGRGDLEHNPAPISTAAAPAMDN